MKKKKFMNRLFGDWIITFQVGSMVSLQPPAKTTKVRLSLFFHIFSFFGRVWQDPMKVSSWVPKGRKPIPFRSSFSWERGKKKRPRRLSAVAILISLGRVGRTRTGERKKQRNSYSFFAQCLYRLEPLLRPSCCSASKWHRFGIISYFPLLATSFSNRFAKSFRTSKASRKTICEEQKESY